MRSINVTKFTIRLSILAALFCTGLTAQTTGSSTTIPDTQPVTKQQRETVEQIVREYLIKNPEVLREAMQALQEKEEKQKNEQTAENIKNLRSEIYSDVDSPVAGNPKGDVSVVVFFDYFCGYCKKSLPELKTLIANDSSVRIIYKEFPILGPQSLVAAKAALAAGRQGKFAEFHQAMWEADGNVENSIKLISTRLGLNYATLQKDMLDPKIKAAIDRNIHLAELLQVDGTPAYLVGGQFVPGAIDPDALAKIVKEERAKLIKTNTQKIAAGVK